MVALIIITGFLGAGKTTLLNTLVRQSKPHEKIGIVQNEFAPVRVKGEALDAEAVAYPVLEVNNGSVFCVCRLKHFTSDLRRFLETHRPTHVFLEASGLSDPSSIGEMVNDPLLHDTVRLHTMLCVADASLLGKTDKMIRYVKQQIMLADTVILNKMDAVADPDAQKHLIQYIRGLNPYAGIIPATHCRVHREDVLKQRGERALPARRSTRPDIRSMVLRTSRKLSHAGMKEFLDAFAPRAYRIKGLIKTDRGLFSVQCVQDSIHTERLEEDKGNTELIAITDDFTLKELKNVYELKRQ